VLLPQLSIAQRATEFWETSCANREFIVRVFGDREAALAWLCELRPM
jgi:hypothetical protein